MNILYDIMTATLTVTLEFYISSWSTVEEGTFQLSSNKLRRQIDQYPKTRFGIISCRFCWRYITVIIQTDMGGVEAGETGWAMKWGMDWVRGLV